METNTQIEFLIRNVDERLKNIFDEVERYKTETLKEFLGVFHHNKTSENKDIKEECHKDVETERHPDGTKFHALYLHKSHVLLLDWLLNHIRNYTNMPYSIELAKQLKDATSAILKRIDEEEKSNDNQNIKTERHKDVKTEECQYGINSKFEAMDFCIEKLMEEVGQIKEYLYDKFEKPKKSYEFHCYKCGKKCFLRTDENRPWFYTRGCEAA